MSVDRDRILEQALKHELRGDATPTPQLARRSFSEGGCLDAETLAAWQDDALNAAQMEEIELHLSTCSRCQSMVAAFARGTAAPVPQPVDEPQRFQWWKWWLAPLAAGAAAVTLWMVVPEQQQVATRPPAPPASIEEKKADAPPAAPETRSRAADSDVKENKLKANAARDDLQQLKDQAVPAPKEAKAETALAQAQAPAAAAPAAPAPTVARAEEAGARVAALEKDARLAFAPLEVMAPDRSVRWRVAGDRIERSENAGQTWALKRERADEGLTSGSAPSPAVAWFAGRAGRVILTVDAGATFADVSVSDKIDISSITATDARTAVIVNATGNRLRTEDAGRTWRPF